jgi:electron transport complex protein RnfC
MTIAAKKVTFPRGGVHPYDDKEYTRGKPLKRTPPPRTVEVPLLQHIGAPAKPAVSKKDSVKKGQLIGEASGYISANVHSPVSGTVKKIESRVHNPTGKKVPAVIIENDGEDEWAEGCNQPQDIEKLSREDMISMVQEAGVVGLGGATFPSHVKLNPPEGTTVSDVIINGAECEPMLTCDHRLMLERTDEIVDALRLIMQIVDATRGYIAIELNKKDAIERFTEAAAGHSDISICPLEVKYPQGAEQQLITAITGREVPSGGGLPSDVGCLVHNVATVLAIRDAIRLRKPLIERAITVTGNGIQEPGNFIESIGTNVADILQRQGVRNDGSQLLIMGGPMMGISQADPHVPLVKGNSGIILEKAGKSPSHRPCIRCGRCIEHCPLGLVPSQLSILCEQEEWEAAKDLNVLECKECGCCAYVCPAERHIVHQIKFCKAELAKKRNKS